MRALPTLLSALLLGLVLASPASALAQDDVDENRVFLVFTDESPKRVEALEASSARFLSTALELSDLRFAGDKERETLYSACEEQIGLSASAARECRLRAANRAFVAQVLEISAQADGRKAWEFTLQAWDPNANELVYTKVVSHKGKKIREAAKTAFPELARAFVCWRGVPAACAGTSVVDAGGQLDVHGIEPSPATCLVNGVEIGPVPNQFTDLPVGEVTVTLRQAGYEDYTTTMNLRRSEMAVLSDIKLSPMPATLAVKSSSPGASIWVNGELKGTTAKARTIEVSVPADQPLRVAVGGNGFTVYHTTVEITPGARKLVEAEIENGGPYIEKCADREGTKALASCTKGCESGDTKSCAKLGGLHYSGEAGATDFKKARRVFQIACDGGELQACNNLGFMAEKGQGGSRDLKQALDLYLLACNGNAYEGCFNLGVVYHGQGGSGPKKKARKLYEKACDGGEGRACYQLGDVHFRGDGVNADADEAAVYFERACDAGTMGGCTNLAFLLESGTHVAKDLDRALELYAKSCGGGEPGACYNLGYLYAQGDVVNRDKTKARKLFDRACDAGLQDACAAIGNLR